MSDARRLRKDLAHWILSEAEIANSEARYRDAVSLIDKAINLDGDDWIFWAHKALFHEDCGDYDGAKMAATKCLEFETEKPLVWNILARLHIRTGAFEKAIKCLRQSLALEDDACTRALLDAVEIGDA